MERSEQVWRSPESEAAFNKAVGIVLVACFVLQFIVSVAFIPVGVLFAIPRELSFTMPRSATLRGDRIWFVERLSKMGAHDQEERWLSSIGLDDGSAPRREAKLARDAALLATDGPVLWAIGRDTFGRVEGTTVTEIRAKERPRCPTPPFVLDGRPTFLDWPYENTIVLRQLVGSEWQSRDFAKLPQCSGDAPCAWAAIPHGDGFDLFLELENDLRWKHVPHGGDLGDPRTWEQVTGRASEWTVFLVNDEPVVVQSVMERMFDFRLQLLRRESGQWKKASSVFSMTHGYPGVVRLSDGTMRVVLSGFNGVATVDVRGTSLVNQVDHGSGFFFFSWGYFAALFGVQFATAALTVVGAWAITRLMAEHRVGTYRHGGKERRFASVMRRGLAAIIDGVLEWALIAPVWVWPMRHPSRFFMPLTWALIAGATLVWWAFTLLGRSWLEGRWGVSPGKWLLGIRVVGTDLQPCGFLRGVGRNALRMIDSAFQSLVGIVFVVRSPTWQRLGDMVARTVVVRVEPGPAELDS